MVTIRLDHIGSPDKKDWEWLTVLDSMCHEVIRHEIEKAEHKSRVYIRKSKVNSTYMIRAIKALRVGTEWWRAIPR